MVVIPTVLLNFIIFFATIEKKYLGTFFSLQTGKEYTQAYFLNGENDSIKSVTLGCTRNYWIGIEDDMKLWVQQNWSRWERENPNWLDEVKRSAIPVEWIPEIESRNRESLRRRSIRRPSVFGN